MAVAPQAGWRVQVDGAAVTVSANGEQAGDDLSIVRAVACAVWDAQFDGRPFTVNGGDDHAWERLHRWSLVHSE